VKSQNRLARKETLSLRPNYIPEGYAPLAQLAPQFDMTENGLRLAVRRGQVRAVLIRNKIYAYEPDLRALFTPRPYPPQVAA
jgi:hypothetical protein